MKVGFGYVLRRSCASGNGLGVSVASSDAASEPSVAGVAVAERMSELSSGVAVAGALGVWRYPNGVCDGTICGVWKGVGHSVGRIGSGVGVDSAGLSEPVDVGVALAGPSVGVSVAAGVKRGRSGVCVVQAGVMAEPGVGRSGLPVGLMGVSEGLGVLLT